MSLQAIIDKIQTAGEAQVKEIRDQSAREVQAIQSRAKVEADLGYQNAYRLALEPAAGERSRILNQARFEAICLSGSAREKLVQTILEKVSLQIQDIRSHPTYPVALRRILLEILPGQNSTQKIGDRLMLEADPRDRELLEHILREENLDIRVRYDLNCWGGIIACSTDGKTRLVNTFESRIEQVLPYLKQQLMARFEKGREGINEGQPVGKVGFA